MSALEALAAYYGIEESFRDARGAERTTSPATRQALLTAMGVTAETDEAASTALAELDRKEWRRMLPPVFVLSQAEPLRVPVNLPAKTVSVSWLVRLEEGTEVTGEVLFRSLAVEARAEIDGVMLERRMLPLPHDLPSGYHRLSILGHDPVDLIVSPGRCWLPPVIAGGRRLWGVSAQLYLLKSAANWGIGDYNDLKCLVTLLVERNADVVGLNPLHAMFLDNPEHASPYSPASRLLLNVFNIDVVSVMLSTECAEASRRIESDEFQAELLRCRAADLVDYSGVARLKLPILEMLFRSWRASGESPDWREFLAYRQAAGEIFGRGCLFLALREYWAAQSPAVPDWHDWPAGFQDPHGIAVTEFARAHAERVTFHAWLQYIADSQLGEAARAGASMAVGLYRDLAVGADPSGAETWADRNAVVSLAQVGAPPDIYNPQGQDWGLPPFHPVALRESSYRSFIELLRANMRHAGGLRIDHVMALKQLYWVPHGLSPAEGAYVRYPIDDLIGILSLESQRNRCLVVGEDLGTVPEGFRERMSRANILSYRVLFFEKDAEGFIPPDQYPTLSLAVAGSHDLPTLHAWWTGSDLELKDKLGLFPKAADASAAALLRRNDRGEFLAALKALGLRANEELQIDELIRAAHEYLASSASAIAMMQIDDITAEEGPVNVPTTCDEHPNWRRRLSMSLEQLGADSRFSALAEILNDHRS